MIGLCRVKEEIVGLFWRFCELLLTGKSWSPVAWRLRRNEWGLQCGLLLCFLVQISWYGVLI